jgi:hypothetical protein
MEVFDNPISAMGPVADLFNMCDGKNDSMVTETQTGFESYSGEFFISASGELDEGKEVCHNYGLKCKEQSMVTYGFSLPEQADCKGPVSAEKSVSDELVALLRLEQDRELEEMGAEIERFAQLTAARVPAAESAPGSDATRDSSWLVRTFQSAQFDRLDAASRQEWDKVRAERLLEWAQNSGIVLGPVEQGMFLKGAPPGVSVRGMRASSNISLHTKLVQVPFEAVLSKYAVQASPIGHVLGGEAASTAE